MSDQKGFVLYTDGSYNHNMRHGGWGIHGYCFTTQIPKKGTGNPQAKPTRRGYIHATNKIVKETDPQVTIETYIEGAGPIPIATSSGNSELVALQNAMLFVLNSEERSEIKTATFITDNEYVVKGVNEYLPKWLKSDYKGSKGTLIKHDDIWRDIHRILTELKADGVDVMVYHIPGHAGDLGNTLTDTLAKIGCRHAAMQSTYSYITPYPAQGFWSRRNDPNPLLNAGRWYTGTGNVLNLVTTPSDYTPYYLGNHGAGFDDELFGKPVPGNMVGVVYANRPDPTLAVLQSVIERIDVDQMERIYIGRLDRVFTPRYAVPILEHGIHALTHESEGSRTKRRDVFAIADMSPLMIDMSPPILSFNGVETINGVQTILNEYLDLHPKYVVTDITSVLFETNGKKLKCIAPETLTVPVRYCLDPIPEVGHAYAEGRIKIMPITLHYKLDLPDINVIKKLTDETPTVTLITWRLGEKWFRHAVVIKTDFGVSIWTAPYGSDIIINS